MSVTINQSLIGSRIRTFDWYWPRWPWTPYNSLYFAFFHRIRQIFRPIISQWLKIDLLCP